MPGKGVMKLNLLHRRIESIFQKIEDLSLLWGGLQQAAVNTWVWV